MISPVMLVIDDNLVIDAMRECGIYDLFHEQAARVNYARVQIKMEHYDQKTGCIYWFTLFKNHPNPADNGYAMTVLPNAKEQDPNLIEFIRQTNLDAGREGDVKILYMNAPELRN